MGAASDTVKWTLEIVDAISAPTRTAILALVGLDKKMNESEKALSNFEKALYGVNLAFKAGSAIWGAASGGLKTVIGAIVSVTGALVTAAGTLKNVFSDIWSVAWENVTYREDTIVAIRQLYSGMLKDEVQLGNAANQLFDHAMQTALKTKFETKDVIDLYSKLLQAKFKTEELDTITAAIADVSTAYGMKRGDQLANWMIAAHGQKRLTWGSLKGMGMRAGEIPMKEIAQLMGMDVSKTPEEKLFPLLQKKFKEGVPAALGIKAVLMNIKSFFDPNSPLGKFAEMQSETLSGIYSNFKEAVTNLFMTRQFGELKGFSTLKQTMLTITGLFNIATPQGKEFLNVLVDMVNDVLQLFEIKPEDAAGLQNTFIGIAKTIETKIIRPFTTWLNEVVKPGLLNMLTGKTGVMSTLKGATVELGRLIGVGVYEGFKIAFMGGKDALLGPKPTPGPGGKETIGSYLWKGFGGLGRGLSSTWNNGLVPVGRATGSIASTLAGYFRLPSYDKGGIVPGMPGEPSIILAHGGEYVDPTGGHGGGGIVIYGNIYITPAGGADVQRMVEQEVLRLVRRQSRRPGASFMSSQLGRAS
jgi:hypothetical protein